MPEVTKFCITMALITFNLEKSVNQLHYALLCTNHVHQPCTPECKKYPPGLKKEVNDFRAR